MQNNAHTLLHQFQRSLQTNDTRTNNQNSRWSCHDDLIDEKDDAESLSRRKLGNDEHDRGAFSPSEYL